MAVDVHFRSAFKCIKNFSEWVMSEKVENTVVICRICGLPVIPEFSPRAEDGHPVHERCYESITVSEIPVEPSRSDK